MWKTWTTIGNYKDKVKPNCHSTEPIYHWFDNRMFGRYTNIRNRLMLMFSIQSNGRVVFHWAVVDNIHIEFHALNCHKINTPVHRYQVHRQVDSITEMIERYLCLTVLGIHEDCAHDRSRNKDDVIDWRIGRHQFENYNGINRKYIDLISIEIN